MTRAFCTYELRSVRVGDAADTFVLPVHILFIGDLGPGGVIDTRDVTVVLTFTESLNSMQTKIIDAIAAHAGQLGYTLNRTSIILPTMAKGS